MSWIASLARVIGAGVPFGGIAVQLSAEMDSRAIQARLRRIEDPISSLHPDVHEVSALIYERLADSDALEIDFSEDELTRYGRVLALLEGARLITGSHAVGRRYAAGFWLSAPSYVLYMSALYEDPDLMERFVNRVDSSPARTRLRGNELSEEYALPLPVVRAVFQLYEQRGLGMLSREVGTVNYYCKA